MRTLQAREIIRIIKDNNLVEHTAKAGEALTSALNDVFSRHSNLVSGYRGQGDGTFQAFDFPDPQTRDKYLGKMRSKGILQVSLSLHVCNDQR